MRKLLIILLTVMAFMTSLFIIRGISYHPDPAGWDCTGDPMAGVCAPVDNRAQQISLLGLTAGIYAATIILIVKKVKS